jgi:hypothetical protein
VNWLDRTKTIYINPREVDCEDATYCIPDFSESGALLESVREIGIINPPFVQRREDKRLVPVLGRNRLKVALQVGMSAVKTGVLPSEMPRADGFRLAFWDNAHRISRDSATLAVLVKRLLELFPRKVASAEFLAPIGVQINGPRLERLRSIAGLEPEILTALAVGRIQEKTAALLTKLQSEERLALAGFTESLGMNANKKAEVIGALFDLSILNSRPITAYLRDKRMVSIAENSHMSVPERSTGVRNFIRSLKFPELVGREEDFSRWLRTLPRSQNISISPTPAFETLGCTIQISADSPAQAERILARLKDA